MSAAPALNSTETFLCVSGEMFLPLAEGALWWPQERVLVVSDLHLEKGSNFASRGQLLPPYDTCSTLTLVERLVEFYQPRAVISLGDSFHDRQAEVRLGVQNIQRIRALTARTDWHWIEGNHDPVPPAHLGGNGSNELRIRSCVFRHEPTGARGEIAGHLHPVARIASRGRALRRKCFITDGNSLVLPSMGTFTGGLNALDPVVSDLFETGPMVFALNGSRVHHIERENLRPDRPMR